MTPRQLLLGTLALLVLFSFGTLRLARQIGVGPGADDRLTLRFAHWNLHAGQREAYDRLIADYERLHPHVRVIQLSVPSRVWPAWQQTQLVGGTAPDIIQIGPNRGATDETIARHFLPLSAAVGSPNPYNADSPLANQLWKATFFDGLTSPWVFFPALQEIYGVPTQLMSLRLFYNATLLEAITGSRTPPATLEDFAALHTATTAHAQRRGLVTLAGSGDYGTFLTYRLVSTHTTDLRATLDRRHVLTPGGSTTLAAFLRGDWSLDQPALTAALHAVQTMGEAMPPGFFQLKREDAALAFTQGRAVAMISGSWDYLLLEQSCPFPLVVAPVPDPADDPRPPPNEAEGQLNAIYALTRAGRHPQQALDFLRYLTSHAASARFAAETQNLPATIDIPLADPNLRVFAPIESPRLSGFGGLAFGPATSAWFQTRAHRLFAPNAAVAHFVQTSAGEYRAAAAQDASRQLALHERATQRDDTLLPAAWFHDPDDPRFAQLATSHLLREADANLLRHALATAAID
jgi:ABC-type glycerol-3-phosphate transport system substrate-binding protein